MCAKLWSRWRSAQGEDARVIKRSGVSQRLPISTMELVISNAERRALIAGENLVLPRVGDIYAALPGITGKLELEYEGEMKGADTVVQELIRVAVAKIYDCYFEGGDGRNRLRNGSTWAARSNSMTISRPRTR